MNPKLERFYLSASSSGLHQKLSTSKAVSFKRLFNIHIYKSPLGISLYRLIPIYLYLYSSNIRVKYSKRGVPRWRCSLMLSIKEMFDREPRHISPLYAFQ